MSEADTSTHNTRGEWRPAGAIALAPINAWPPRLAETVKWLFGFPGYLWPYNLFWVAVSVVTWAYLTPDLASMASFEIWWVALLYGRNFAFILVLFGGMHLYFYVYKRQGTSLKFTTQPMATNNRRFLFKDQVKDNMFYSLMFGVPTITGYEAITYWAFANGYLGLFDFGGDPVLFWGWFVGLLVLAPVIHAVHFYFAHRLLHVKFLYKTVHSLHHHNIEVGPWSGLSMHPVEHILYFSTVVVQWFLALHPVNALYQIHLAAFQPAQGHSGFAQLMIGKKLGIDGGSYFHYLHHKFFECNYGGSLIPLDNVFGTFHDGTDKGQQMMRDRMRSRRQSAG